MLTSLLFFAFPLLLAGLVWFFVWLTVKEQRQITQTTPEKNRPAREPPGRWWLVTEGGEHGPFGFSQIQRFRDNGLVQPDSRLRDAATGEILIAAALPGLSAPAEPSCCARDFVQQPVEFQTFNGHLDPVRLGKGSVWIKGGVLSIRGRGRRLFAIRKREEHIPVGTVYDVVVEDRLLRFRVEGNPTKTPRLLRLASPEAAMELAACLPARTSPEGAQVRADTAAFARFIAERGKPYATFALIAVNLAFFLYAASRGAGWASGKPAVLFELGGNLAPATTQGEWWRLISAMFLHSGFMHLAFNMLALWDAGRITERLMGRWRYLALYLSAGIVGGIASINWQMDKVGIGASGAVFGLYGALATALLVNPALLPPTIMTRLRNGALAFILYSLINGALHGQIDNAAHIGGLLAGAALGVAIFSPPRRAWILVGATASLLAVGSFRAVGFAEPVRDEIQFRRFLVAYGAEEARLNSATKGILTTVKIAEAATVADRLDQEVVAGWKTQERQISRLIKLGSRSQAIRDPMAQFIRLKRESLEMLRDAMRSNDAPLLLRSMDKNREANEALQRLNDVLKAAPAAGGKPNAKASAVY